MLITSKDRVNIEENFKVEAGPGAGKTDFLVNHIKNIIENSKRLSNSRKIACITYTNIAVDTIMKRVGSNAANMVEVTTIHSFLYKNVIKPFCSFIPDEYELNTTKINGHDEFNVSTRDIREWLENYDFSGLRHPNSKNQILRFPAMTQALKNWLLSMRCTFNNATLIFECENRKAVGYDNENNSVRLNNNNLEILSGKIIDLKKIYWRKGNLDHNDVLFFSYVLVNRYPFILDVLRAKFPYMFIDEYQDTNPIQSYILDEIRKKETIVGVIGDKAQSIYGFQGANPELFESFTLNDSCKKYTINNNHRSSDKIIKFLNDIRNDIIQEAKNRKNDDDVVIVVGDVTNGYQVARERSKGEVVTSLSRENITSNAMKQEIDKNNIDKKMLERFYINDTNDKRRNCIISFVGAIEHANNGDFKEAINKIEWIFKDKDNPKITAIHSLMKTLANHEEYCDSALIDFFNLFDTLLDIDLPKVTRGAPKKFYSEVSYKEIALCLNVAEDSSNHITIHKAKGSEFDNVFIVNCKQSVDFLTQPDLSRNEEHRVLYVGLSRAKKRLFIHLDNLNKNEETLIRNKYPYIVLIRL